MDKIYVKHKAKREDYFKRQFSGRPLKEIKKQAEGIFNDARALLCQHKHPDVHESFIDHLCDDMVDLLTRSYKMFEVIHTESPTMVDAEKLQGLVDHYMVKYREMMPTVTPKAHVLEDHILDKFIIHIHHGLPL